MTIFNVDYISKYISLFLFQTTFCSLGIYFMIKQMIVYNFLSILIILFYIFYFIEQISLLSMIVIYIKNYKKSFDDSSELIAWKRKYLSYNFYVISFIFESILHFIIGILFIAKNNDIGINKNILIMVFFEFGYFKFILLCFYLIYLVRNRYSIKNFEEDTSVILIVIDIDNQKGKYIGTIPKIKLDKIPNYECSICLTNNTNNDWCNLPCDHSLHSECAKKWISLKNTCPLCRYEVFELPKL